MKCEKLLNHVHYTLPFGFLLFHAQRSGKMLLLKFTAALFVKPIQNSLSNCKIENKICKFISQSLVSYFVADFGIRDDLHYMLQ